MILEAEMSRLDQRLAAVSARLEGVAGTRCSLATIIYRLSDYFEIQMSSNIISLIFIL